MKDPTCENVLHNLHDLLYNSSPPIIWYPKVPSYKILDSLYIINSGIVIFGLFLSYMKLGTPQKHPQRC